MKYDDASWHFGGDFPEGLPDEAGGTHIGMFLAWAFLNGFASDFHRVESTDALERVLARTMTGREFLFTWCDGKLTDEDFSPDGNAFARDYYEKGYMERDVEQLGEGLESAYHAEDTWETFDRLRPLFDERFAAWRQQRDAATAGAAGRRELRFDDGKSRKFWAISVDDRSHTVHFGRIGTQGQTRTKTFSSKDEAAQSAEKLIQQKLKKGYSEAWEEGGEASGS